ncbi:MAG TPA: galactokinase [Methylocystis sp.]|nr:galactokinase [Methylocystis sp.]
MNETLARALAQKFCALYGREPSLFRAPGRVNLIGEHTDYNDGYVLPAAIDLAAYVAIAPREDRRLEAKSLRLDPPFACSLDVAEPRPAGDWSDYVRGVALELARAGHRLVGADVLIDSDLPMGAGLSTSAAMEVGFGLALATISGVTINRTELALLCQRAENGFVGARCGVMDQFISCRGVAGAALLLDCRTLETREVAIDESLRLLVCDTKARHQIASGDYNTRREECEQAVARLAQALPRVRALRDVSGQELGEHASLLSPALLRRARHVVEENARTLRMAAALESGDLAEAGRLMNASHASLRDDFEVSCKELDVMVEAAQSLPGVYGARMMGGGFGGCTINLVDGRAVENVAERVAAVYQAKTGIGPNVFCCAPAAGAGPIAL